MDHCVFEYNDSLFWVLVLPSGCQEDGALHLTVGAGMYAVIYTLGGGREGQLCGSAGHDQQATHISTVCLKGCASPAFVFLVLMLMRCQQF